MTTSKTKDTEKTLEQVYELASNGADIVRVTCNEVDAATSLIKISTRSPVPIIADIHFQYKLALAAIEAGVQGLRLNPGNIRDEKHIKEVAKEALLAEIPIRVGVNAGSLDKDIAKKYPESSTSWSPYRIFNVGNSKSVRLIEFITALENEIGEKAIKIYEPMQEGDVKFTSADTSLIESWIGFKPNTELKLGIKEFVRWYKSYYKI